jgi:DNA repair protein RadA/Sms
MPKSVTQYICNNCGATSSAWAGRCNVCGEWNSLEEQLVIREDKRSAHAAHSKVLPTEAINYAANHREARISCGIMDIDNILGGGIVPGSVILIAGQPGIGKSTLLLQIAQGLAQQATVLYISGEESVHQVGVRAKRLEVASDKIQLATSTCADDIAETINSGQFKVVIVDSIQTLSVNMLTSAAGTISQISSSAALIMAAAKSTNTAVILAGHVTKEGNIAGPKVLEHVVDVVLQLEGDTYGGFKILRSSKNRYGSTTEASMFEMTDKGLQVVANPSAALLAERQISDGSIVLATLEGSRPLLVEVQALVNRTAFGYPKRTASGIDQNRVNLLTAVLEKRTKLQLSDKDIYLNIVGGIQLNDPAADLAVCLAIGSAAKGLCIQPNTVVFGEVGLSGEIRHVPFIEKRINEAKKMGFTIAVGPHPTTNSKIIGLSPVSDIRSALNKFLTKH